MKKSLIIAAAAVSFTFGGASGVLAQGFEGSEVDFGFGRVSSDGDTVSSQEVDARVGVGFGNGFGAQGDLGYTGLAFDGENADYLSFRALGRYDMMAGGLSFAAALGRLQPLDDDDGEAAPFYSFHALYNVGLMRLEGGLTRYDGDGALESSVTAEGEFEVVPGIAKVYGGASRLNLEGDDRAHLLSAGLEQGFGPGLDLHGEITRAMFEDYAATEVAVGGTVDLSREVELYGSLGHVSDGDESGAAITAGLRWKMGRAQDDGLFSGPVSELDLAGF